jgi:hypothetical protein
MGIASVKFQRAAGSIPTRGPIIFAFFVPVPV